MSVYLHDIPLSDARARFKTALEEQKLWRVLGTETIPLDENALGRVLAEPAWAKVSSPHYHASAMDGFAVRAEQTDGAQPNSPVRLRIGPEAVYLDTGDALPDGFDAVIPIENVEALDEQDQVTPAIRQPACIRIRAGVTPWSHVRPMGEDIVQTQLILPPGQVLRPVDLGALAAGGWSQVIVARRPKVAIIPTGTELVPIGSPLKRGDILEYNSLVLAAQVRAWGGHADRLPITPDVQAEIRECVRQAARDHDLILLNAGSSAGAEDFSAKVVEELGTMLVHGVAVRPGHPVILGLIHKPGTAGMLPIIGVPGYPVSAALTGEIFVEPLLARWTGRLPIELPVESVELTRKITSPAGDEDYVRVVVGRVGDRLLAAPLTRGAGVITSLVRADGLAVLPAGVQGVEAGQRIDVRLYRSRPELERTIFCIGSHDMVLDLLAQYLSERGRRFSSANVGSMGGLAALQRGEAHVAGSHLLDPDTGLYNVRYVKEYLAGIPVKIFGFVGRQQGLMTQKGNPKNICALEDLIRPEVRFVNRQRGAGTRLLLEYQLEKKGISKELIQGYNQEEYTHLGVAAAVASGRADCGLGIPAAAQALDLNFLPLFEESYQLVIPKQYADDALLAPLFDVLADNEFKLAVANMPGYDVSQMGQLLFEA